MLKSILVAIDASGPSHRAVDLAADMAVKYNAQLYLLHVMRDMDLPPELSHMAEVEHIHGPRSDVLTFVGKKILNDAKERAKKKGAARIETELKPGDPATTLIEYANAHNIDLIVMGTRGLGNVKSALMGSVSRKVSNLSDSNVMIVK